MQSLAKRKIHWLFTQTIEIKAFEKDQKEFTIIYLLIDLICRLVLLISSVAFVQRVLKVSCLGRPLGVNVHNKCNLRIQVRMQIFRKMSQKALNRVLIMPKERARKMLPIPLKIMDFENIWFSIMQKHWKFRISVPMSYITFL